VRFKAEARAAARLRHRAIVPIFDVGVQGDRHYIAMEYIAGQTLDAWVRQRRPDANAVATVLAEVAEALAHAHSRGIVHRDVKPGNILIDGQDRPHITDFGLAMDVKADTRLTQSGVALGTPTYMSPEQARGDMENLDGRSDIFSLGSVCYEAIAGRPPFVGASVMDTLLRVVQDEPRRLRHRVPNVPEDLEAVCMKALEKEPAHRYDNAAALATDLARVARGEPVSARRPALWRRVRRRAKQHRAALIASAGVLSGAAVTGLVWLFAQLV
ncbi:MAG: serine/threonine-protein kinase, partial [Planctomycetota bacterium]